MNTYASPSGSSDHASMTVNSIQFNDDITDDIGTPSKRARTIYTQTLEATNVNTTNVNATGVLDGAALFVTSGTIGTLTSTTANINTANLITATGTSLNFSTGTVGTLTSTTAGITTGNIDTLNNTTSTITTGNIGTLNSTSSNITSATIGALTSTSIQAASINSSGGLFADLTIESNTITTNVEDYTVAVTDRWILVNNPVPPRYKGMLLPFISSVGVGQKYTFSDKDGSAVIHGILFKPRSGELINGLFQYISMNEQWGSRTIQSDGTQWFILTKG